jgi:riboflavin synthase
VQGHVDGIGTVQRRESSEHWDVVTIGVQPALARYIAVKGSITVDGVSLTVSGIVDGADPAFEVSLIPTTLERTTLGRKQPGDHVNIEVDVIAKYVERLLAADGAVVERPLEPDSTDLERPPHPTLRDEDARG